MSNSVSLPGRAGGLPMLTYLFERCYYFLDNMETLECGIVVFDELEKSRSHILIGQMDQYFNRSQKGRERSYLLIPEPFFVHSDLTTGIQLPDFVAYIVSWGFRKISGMNEPARDDLEDLAEEISKLRYKTKVTINGGEFTVWSFAHIQTLCETLELARSESEPEARGRIAACPSGP